MTDKTNTARPQDTHNVLKLDEDATFSFGDLSWPTGRPDDWDKAPVRDGDDSSILVRAAAAAFDPAQAEAGEVEPIPLDATQQYSPLKKPLLDRSSTYDHAHDMRDFGSSYEDQETRPHPWPKPPPPTPTQLTPTIGFEAPPKPPRATIALASEYAEHYGTPTCTDGTTHNDQHFATPSVVTTTAADSYWHNVPMMSSTGHQLQGTTHHTSPHDGTTSNSPDNQWRGETASTGTEEAVATGCLKRQHKEFEIATSNLSPERKRLATQAPTAIALTNANVNKVNQATMVARGQTMQIKDIHESSKHKYVIVGIPEQYADGRPEGNKIVEGVMAQCCKDHWLDPNFPGRYHAGLVLKHERVKGLMFFVVWKGERKKKLGEHWKTELFTVFDPTNSRHFSHLKRWYLGYLKAMNESIRSKTESPQEQKAASHGISPDTGEPARFGPHSQPLTITPLSSVARLPGAESHHGWIVDLVASIRETAMTLRTAESPTERAVLTEALKALRGELSMRSRRDHQRLMQQQVDDHLNPDGTKSSREQNHNNEDD